MKKKIGLRIGLIFCLLLFSTRLYAGVYFTKDEALKMAFPEADSIEKKVVIVTDEQKKKIQELLHVKRVSRIYKYYAGTKNGKIMGYAKIDNVIGKSQPITFMVVLNLDGSIKMVEILAYRETQGGEIRQKRFRDQFKGKKVTDALRLNSDIRNISSATLSCRAITDGVRRIAAYLSVLAIPQYVQIDNEEKPQVLQETRVREKQLGTVSTRLISFRRSQLIMGTTLEITIYVDNRRNADRIFSLAFSEAARIENLLSTYIEDSEISRLNLYAKSKPLVISIEVIDLLARSKEITRETRGAFDITVAPLIRLWKEAAGKNELPSINEIYKAKERVGAHYIEMNLEKQEVRLPEGVNINVGGIGKGFALDRVGRILLKNGIKSALLNFGGNILTVGIPPDKRYWIVHIRDPLDRTKSISVLYLTGGAVSTSADYERGLYIQGNRYSHIIDPRTGRPVTGILSVTVVAPTATEADAFSTALYVLGFEEGGSFAKESSIAAMILAEGKEIFRTSTFSTKENLISH